jgi:4-hydroxy-3-polyprenylbenzoate decarboxylase
MKRHIAVAITGASGAIYGIRLIEELLAVGSRISLLISSAGFTVLEEECGLSWYGLPEEIDNHLQEYFAPAISMGLDNTDFEPSLTYYAENDFFAPIASGSSAPDAMIVAPCSMGTLGRIAAGLSGNLLERAADVMLKEGKPLLLLPRETPFSAIHLENMLKLARLGVRIIPAMPGFYSHPQTVADIINFVVGKLLDQLGIEGGLFQRWGE